MTDLTIVLAMRASPDWAELAHEKAAGCAIAPSRYLPADNARFPSDIPQLIERWNRFSGLSFFECRHRLRNIAAANLAAIPDITAIRAPEVAWLLERIGNCPILLFFHNDDDWFHPDIAGLIDRAGLATARFDAVVFPFYRLASNLITFTRGGAGISDALGNCAPFRFRYCTNNYGLTARALRAGPARLAEHMDASETAASLGFVDDHCEMIVSATNKTPCSASWLRNLPDDRAAFRRYVRDYVEVLEGIATTSVAEWITKPLGETIDLFRASLA